MSINFLGKTLLKSAMIIKAFRLKLYHFPIFIRLNPLPLPPHTNRPSKNKTKQKKNEASRLYQIHFGSMNSENTVVEVAF